MYHSRKVVVRDRHPDNRTLADKQNQQASWYSDRQDSKTLGHTDLFCWQTRRGKNTLDKLQILKLEYLVVISLIMYLYKNAFIYKFSTKNND